MALRHLREYGDIHEGPTALERIVEGLEIRLRSHPFWNDPGFTGEAFQDDGFRLIVVNSLLLPGRKRFTIAHEICHIAGEHHTPRTPTQERLADIYATELLMPLPRIMAQLRQHGPDITYLARLNAVSYSAMRRRLLELRQTVEE